MARAPRGGATETMALRAGGPANDLGTTCAPCDPRGTPRTAPRDAGACERAD